MNREVDIATSDMVPLTPPKGKLGSAAAGTSFG